MTSEILTKYVLVAVIAYALGNISPSIIYGKLHGVDIRKVGSGNAGTTNTIRVFGVSAGLIVLAADMLKAFLAVKIGSSIADIPGEEIAFAFVVIGHCFPAIYGFKGGKGVAAAFGAALALNWPSAVAAFIIAAVLLLVSRRMSVASMGAAISYPLLTLYYESAYTKFAIFAAAFLIIMHIPNIKRLLKGEEPPLFGRKDKKEDMDKEIKNENVPETVVTQDTEEEDTVSDINPKDYYEETEIPDLGNDACDIAVIGNGSFGTAMANLLVHNGHKVTLYGRNKDAIDLMKRTRMNEHYLPFAVLSDKINYTSSLQNAVTGRDIVVFAVPTQQFRSVSDSAAEFMDKSTIVVNLAKGIEQKSLKRLSEVAAETIPENTYVAVSGPSHAEELVRNLPAGVVAVSEDRSAAEKIQDVMMSEQFRVYTQDDMAGVEIAGAVKNVIAITTGICDGMKLGSNARAAVMTRAIHEIQRLGDAIGAKAETFSGLSGIGDLIVTCSTNLSRNRRCGLMIGLGLEPEEAVKKVGSVVEGFYTADAVVELAAKYDVEMPICEATYKVLKGELDPKLAVKMLMSRSKKDELK